MRTAGWIGLVAAVVLIVVAIALPVPAAEFNTSWGSRDRIKTYVGGDAYNFIIEAALRGGRIAGAETTKAVAGVGGAVLFALSLMVLGYAGDAEERERDRERRHVQLVKLLESVPDPQTPSEQ